MSAPNIASPTTINGKTAHLSATNSEADIIAAVTTGHAIHVQAIYAANATTNGATPGWISIWHKSGGTEYPVCGLRTIMPANAAINLLDGKVLWLEEGDSLRAQSDGSGTVVLNVPYADFS
jgi:hypothetical protein